MTQPQDPQERATHEPAPENEPPPVRPRRSQRRLITATCLAVVLAFVALALPTPYVVEAPGPAVNTLGKEHGKQLIEVSGHKTYPTSGSLDLTTVYVLGGAQGKTSFFRVLQAWADPSEDVYPEEALYPRTATSEQISDNNAAEMDDSQQSSVAAALGDLGIDYEQELTVAGLANTTNKGLLQTDDVLRRIDGRPITDLDMLRSALQDSSEGKPRLEIERAGQEKKLTAKTTVSDDGKHQLGVYLGTRYTFPFDVKFTLSDIGGPSAGMMFALGIIDTLTPEDLTGGNNIAGTGTIDADGKVGRIGGIAQKLVGARGGGADYFLAPAGNCGDIDGRVPDGLTVVKVSTLEQARQSVESIASGADPETLSTCGS
ncbi:MAG: YlbL family protein [Arthrobacter sp.]|uniref:YlbL family protein n=1 Tax=unclassified Arthrobacter TaxID=235627 RepID=UPI0026537BEA|nr:signal protein PDZ [Micrococcaceae bacterium]MDN5813351.1 signal protein PDZ [Micrococcaceae bacterium]MDN5879450.1 signal protein PDZ [Micrococcaceae bacterium]MDN5887616.1 signal protein PDZ [Micrococcaceae bacterium]MDN5905971.1 signal protein PDZ [Micrococcaceae bacterium]